MTKLVRVMSVADLPDGKIKGATIEGEVILFANVGGAMYAVSGTCTHEAAELSNGTVSGYNLVCPLHGAEFDLRTGSVENPPAEQPLKTYTVKIVEGQVMIEL